MAEERAIQTVENANVPAWQQGLALAVNETYSFANNSLFYGCMPAYYRDYAYQYIKPCVEWMSGYVPSLHQQGISGIVSTRIAPRLISGYTKQIVGEKLIFKTNDRTIDQDHQILHFVSEWSEEMDVIKAVYAAIGHACALGTSLLKINKTDDGKLWWEAVRFDHCFYETTFRNEITDATFLIRGYVNTKKDNTTEQFFLTEHRYWKTWELPVMEKQLDGEITVIHAKGDKTPMVEYAVHRVTGTIYNATEATAAGRTSVKWEELPRSIRDAIKKDYGTLMVDEPMELGFPNLGVVALRNGEIDLSVPTAQNFGESMLIGIQSELITYELANSYLIRDMYNGKGSVLIPKSISLGDVLNPANPLTGVPDKIETIPGVAAENQSPIVNQFDLRPDQWQLIIENQFRNIAVKWNTNPKILASFLNGGTQMTATQVDSEDDVMIANICHTRAYFKNDLNKLLDTTLRYYGFPAAVKLDFANPSLVNKDRLLQRVMGEYQVGFIDLDEAIRTMNPDLDEEALQRKIDIAKARQQQLALSQFTDMNEEGGFGPTGPDGSTYPGE